MINPKSVKRPPRLPVDKIAAEKLAGYSKQLEKTEQRLRDTREALRRHFELKGR